MRYRVDNRFQISFDDHLDHTIANMIACLCRLYECRASRQGKKQPSDAFYSRVDRLLLRSFSNAAVE